MPLERSYSLKEVAIKIGLLLILPAIAFMLASLVLGSLGIKDVNEAFIILLFQLIFYTWFLALNKRFRKYIRESLCYKIKMRTATLYIVIGIVLLGFTSFFILGSGIESNESQREIFNVGDLDSIMTFQNVFVIFAICIGIPLYEELLFRGLLFSTLSNKYGTWLSLVISSVIFGLLHGDVFLATSIFGLVFCCIFYKTKSLLPGILLHMIWNSLSVLLM
ncbi:lysostaphin resistance A-like protein [Paenibacillus sp. SAF-068]|uniref:CPBP family intramembrane glutamic endopeptidase n=1 Tax=Paenibacillus sp. SAF-068 TaxID=3436864 RepID=UPI003F7CED22